MLRLWTFVPFLFLAVCIANAQTAIDGLIKRAEGGDATAQHELGWKYSVGVVRERDGSGVNQDLDLAIKWLN